VGVRGDQEEAMNDYHVHSAFSDGRGDVDGFVGRAHELGLAEIGFAEHLVPRALDSDGYGLPASRIPDYVRAVRAAGEDTAVRVLLGAEIDYAPGAEAELDRLLSQARFDYVIGAVHFTDGFAFDLPSLADDPRWEDPDALYRSYWDTVARAASWGRFDVVGHLDLPKTFGRRPSAPMGAAEDAALEAVRQAGLAIELNTSGLRSSAGEAYPAPSLLARAARMGIPLTFGSDAHAAADVGRDFGRAVVLARAAGYTTTLRLSDRVAEALA